MNISKYFWDLNEKAVKETKVILKNSHHPKFFARMVTFLSRCDQPKELFSFVSKKEFIENWPKIKLYWLKLSRESTFRDWWETLYEQLLQEHRLKRQKPKGNPSVLFSKIGNIVRSARVEKGMSQDSLAFSIGMRQPDISRIEEGKKNITLETLARLCKVLDIKKIEL